MKEYFCEQLNDTITCFHNGIIACCSGHGLAPEYIRNYTNKDEKIFDWTSILEKKYYYFSLLNEKDIDKSPCKGCFYLKEKTETDIIRTTFKQINISHWLHCNCGCIYCTRMCSGGGNSIGKIIKSPKKSEYYDIVPVIQNMYQQNLFTDKNLIVCVQGGDINVLKEFPDFIKLFLEKNPIEYDGVFFVILSNAIIYQPIIKNLLEKRKLKLVTALDSGCRETYKRIKRVDKFNDVVKNLKKYCTTSEYPEIMIKYILVKNINDNETEIKKFIDLMKEIGIKFVEFVLPDAITMVCHIEIKSIPNHWHNLYSYFTELCKKNNINCEISERTKFVLEHLQNKEIKL